jgi:hypothetical protein
MAPISGGLIRVFPSTPATASPSAAASTPGPGGRTKIVFFLLRNHTRRFILPAMRHNSLDPPCGRESLSIRALRSRDTKRAIDGLEAMTAEPGTTHP